MENDKEKVRKHPDFKSMPSRYLLNRLRGRVALHPNPEHLQDDNSTTWLILLVSRSLCALGGREDEVYRIIDELVNRGVLSFYSGRPQTAYPYPVREKPITMRDEIYRLIDSEYNYEILPGSSWLQIKVVEGAPD